jgi:hypothetical protein
VTGGSTGWSGLMSSVTGLIDSLTPGLSGISIQKLVL